LTPPLPTTDFQNLLDDSVDNGEELDIDDALTEFNQVLKNIDIHFRDPESDLDFFRRPVAVLTGQINLFLLKECEQFGMSAAIYKGIMACSKANKIRFDNIMAAGNFKFEGRAEYKTRQLLFTISDGGERKASHIPESWLKIPAAEEVEEVVGEKRQLKRGERGPGKKDYTTVKSANQIISQVTEKINELLDDLLFAYTPAKRNLIVDAAILNLRKNYRRHEDKSVNNEINLTIVNSLKEYLNGLKKFGGKFSQVESTIENVISSISVVNSNSTEMAKFLNVTRRRIVTGKERRKIFNNIIEKEENRNRNDETIDSSDNSEVDVYNADFGDDETILSSSEDEVESEEDDDNENTEMEIPTAENTEFQSNGGGKKKKQNLFQLALTPTERKIRNDKLDLSVVRDWSHNICRLDTFASAKIYVHNYDGTHSYHQQHVKCQAIKFYHELFDVSNEYHNWQQENTRIIIKGNTERRIIPTIKLRLLTNAFCPCCMNQKQRDCANHIQINYYNALKAVGNLRRFQGISVPMRDCPCLGHKNENYLQCHTSLSKFMDACGDIPLYTLVCDMYLPVYPPQPAYFTVLHLVVTRLLY
jgi:hypothetical protein